MREITHGDIRAAARVLLTREESGWPQVMARMLTQAHDADLYRKVHGRHHPLLGNGTLMSAAFGMGAATEPLASDHRYLTAIRSAIDAVLEWRMRGD